MSEPQASPLREQWDAIMERVVARKQSGVWADAHIEEDVLWLARKVDEVTGQLARLYEQATEIFARATGSLEKTIGAIEQRNAVIADQRQGIDQLVADNHELRNRLTPP